MPYNILPYLSILVLIEDKLVKTHHLVLIAQNLKKALLVSMNMKRKEAEPAMLMQVVTL